LITVFYKPIGATIEDSTPNLFIAKTLYTTTLYNDYYRNNVELAKINKDFTNIEFKCDINVELSTLLNWHDPTERYDINKYVKADEKTNN